MSGSVTGWSTDPQTYLSGTYNVNGGADGGSEVPSGDEFSQFLQILIEELEQMLDPSNQNSNGGAGAGAGGGGAPSGLTNAGGDGGGGGGGGATNAGSGNSGLTNIGGGVLSSNATEQALAQNLETRYGLNATQAAGVLGNIQQESGFVSDINQGGATGGPSSNNADDNENGYGLAQWGGQRKVGLEQYAAAHGESADSTQAQIGYMDQELDGQYSNTIRDIKQTTTTSQAALVWDEDYEQASDPEMGNRDANAAQALSQGL